MSETHPDDKVDTLISKNIIPIIDLNNNATEDIPDQSILIRAAKEINEALTKTGLALLVNHGIPQEKVNIAWKYLDNFCKLPTQIKNNNQRRSDDNHGYVEPGQEKFQKKFKELRHSFNITSLNSKDFPEDSLPGFTDHIKDLISDYKSLVQFLFQAFEIALNLPKNFFSENHLHMLSDNTKNLTTLRILYYPPVAESISHIDTSETSAEIIRCGQHTDYGTFTLLSQDSEGGLEVRLPNSGKNWERVGHLPGSILVNCGQIFQMWTADRYHAVLHRVIVPKEEKIRNSARHSIAYFCHPDNATMISSADIPSNYNNENCKNKISKKKASRSNKERVYNALELVQRRARDTYD